MLFLSIAEITAIIIRASKAIRGITVNDINIKLCQLVDDMTPFLTSTKSVCHTIKIFEKFYRYGGLKLSKSKTNCLFDHWSDPEEAAQLNFNKKISAIRNILKNWASQS